MMPDAGLVPRTAPFPSRKSRLRSVFYEYTWSFEGIPTVGLFLSRVGSGKSTPLDQCLADGSRLDHNFGGIQSTNSSYYVRSMPPDLRRNHYTRGTFPPLENNVYSLVVIRNFSLNTAESLHRLLRQGIQSLQLVSQCMRQLFANLGGRKPAQHS